MELDQLDPVGYLGRERPGAIADHQRHAVPRADPATRKPQHRALHAAAVQRLGIGQDVRTGGVGAEHFVTILTSICRKSFPVTALQEKLLAARRRLP